MDADRKRPTPVYQPFLKQLVIEDLLDAERSGNFDRDVLLFVQDGYVMRALKEGRDQLAEAFAAINEQNPDHAERADLKRGAVVTATLELYTRLKAEGDETTGVRGYAGAAGVYLNGAIVDYETYLRDVAQHLEQSVRVGHSPDIDWLAGHTYALLARASRTMELAEATLGGAVAARAEVAIGSGLRSIGSASQDSVVVTLGKQLWRTVEAIDRAPQVHVANDGAAHDEVAILETEDAWNFEPGSRSEFEP